MLYSLHGSSLNVMFLLAVGIQAPGWQRVCLSTVSW
jgi:hypothetical protein